jgi:hypothetical protein
MPFMVRNDAFPSRSFLLYWRANVVSSFGTYITLFALQALVVLTLHGSAAEVGWFLPRLVSREHLQRAHARGDGADAVAMTAGPTVAGLSVKVAGAPLAVLVNAAGYIYSYSAVTLRRIAVIEPAPTGDTRARDLVREIRDGVRWVYRGSGLTTLAVATHVWFVGNAVVSVVVAPYALVTLSLTPFQFGLTGALGGVGAAPDRSCALTLPGFVVPLVAPFLVTYHSKSV